MIEEKLQALKDALEVFDIDEADKLMDALDTYRMSEEVLTLYQYGA